jgi:S-(hydroxymethyl)glutathione dehydrogenase / alcohol dehydrogenase
MKVKAAVLREIGKPLTIEEIEVDPPKANEVAIKVVASGVCHSDYSVMHGIVPPNLPVVCGHEAAGIVEEVGPGVTHVKPGDAVIASLLPSCGKCPFCAEGKPYLCTGTMATMGQMTMPDGTTRFRQGKDPVHAFCAIGSFAERAVLPVAQAIKIDAGVPLETVCLIGCAVTTGVGAALNTARVEAGSSVAVIGCGGVGLSIIQGARVAGASTIIAIDPVAEKREIAKKLGATDAIDPRSEDVRKAVRKLTGAGVHYAFEALGRTETIEQAWGLLRQGGTAVVVGVPKASDEAKLRVGGFMAEKRIMGSVYGSALPERDIPRFVDLYRKGKLDLDGMITRRIALEQVNEAFEQMGRGEGARSVIVY